MVILTHVGGSVLQVANNKRKIVNLVENTPLYCPQKLKNGRYKPYRSAKRRKAGGDEGMVTSHPRINLEGCQSWTRHKVAIPNKNNVTQKWCGYPMHDPWPFSEASPS